MYEEYAITLETRSRTPIPSPRRFPLDPNATPLLDVHNNPIPVFLRPKPASCPTSNPNSLNDFNNISKDWCKFARYLAD